MGWSDAWNSAMSGIGDAWNATVDGVGSAWNAVSDATQDVVAGVTGGETSQEQDNREASEATQAKAARERAALERQNQGLEDGISGYDPPSIKGQENWQSFSHQEIFDRNQSGIQPGRVAQAEAAWGKIGADLRGIGERFSTELRGKIQEGWEGDAAEAAAKAGAPLSQWMVNSGNAFELTGNRVKETNTATEQVKGMVPEPRGASGGEAVGAAISNLGSPGGLTTDMVARMKERQGAERQAQETMARVFSPTVRGVDSQMPSYRDVHDKPVPPPDPPPESLPTSLPPPVSPNQLGSNTSGIPSAHTSSVNTPMPSTNVPPSYAPVPDGPAGSGSSWAPGGGGYPGGGHPGGGYPGAGPPGGPGAGRGIPGGGQGFGAMPMPGSAPGVGGGSGAGAKGNVLGAGGRAGSGQVGGPNAPAAARGSSGTSTGAGARGGPMGGAGQRGGQGSEEEEHERPSWLEENDDVWLNDMPSVAPPVFGE